MTNLNEQLTASLILSTYFDDADLKTRDDLIKYADALPNATDDFRTELIRMIDLDIADALHNTNIDFFIPEPIMNLMTDDELDAIERFILDNLNAELIADALLSKFPA